MDDAIDRCIDYCATYDPSFPSRIRGATPEQLARLDAAAGRPSSELHRRYLERLGNDSAWLDLGPFDARIEPLIHSHETTPGSTPEGIELFAIALDEPYADAFLIHRGAEAGVGLHTTMEGAGYAGFRDWALRPIASSLASLLCLIPLERYTLAPMPLKRRLSLVEPREESLSRIEEIASAYGFTPLWFSDAMARVLVRAATWMVVQRSRPDGPIGLRVASTDRLVAEELIAALEEGLPLQQDD